MPTMSSRARNANTLFDGIAVKFEFYITHTHDARVINAPALFRLRLFRGLRRFTAV